MHDSLIQGVVIIKLILKILVHVNVVYVQLPETGLILGQVLVMSKSSYGKLWGKKQTEYDLLREEKLEGGKQSLALTMRH